MLDPVLRPFVDATDDAEAERELERLMQQHAMPLASAIVARKLRTFGASTAARPGPRDREDVVADATVTLLERLRAARSGTETAPIEDFERYAAAVVHSACAHHIRQRYPARARLKNRLRYVLSTDARLAIWTGSGGEAVCGLAEWAGAAAEHEDPAALADVVDKAHGSWSAMSPRTMADATVEVARAAGGPLGFDAFVSAIADAAGIVEPREVDPVEAAPEHVPQLEASIDQRRALADVWREVRNLPVRQRIALLLNLRDATGAGLLWLMPVLGVATIREIARALEIAAADFARLWRQLPLDDAAISERLGCTRQQVINLRMSARKRLLNRVAPPLHTAADRRRSRANLAPVSSSLRDSV